MTLRRLPFLLLFLLAACASQQSGRPVPSGRTTRADTGLHVMRDTTTPIVAPFVDTTLACFDYPGADHYDGYQAEPDPYNPKKKELSESEAGRRLFRGMDSIRVLTYYTLEDGGTYSVEEYLNSHAFYFLGTLAERDSFRVIAYEETDRNGASLKIVSTIGRDGRYIDRVYAAMFGPAGSYTRDDGVRGSWYDGYDGCVSNHLTIEVPDEGWRYQVQKDGTIRAMKIAERYGKLPDGRDTDLGPNAAKWMFPK